MNDSDDKPDLSKPLSRWSAPYWAMTNGLAEAWDSDARWSVFLALLTHLPNVEPGEGRIEALTGLSHSTVVEAIQDLRAGGAINYADNAGGARNTNRYTIADIRHKEVVEQIVASSKTHIDQKRSARKARRAAKKENRPTIGQKNSPTVVPCHGARKTGHSGAHC